MEALIDGDLLVYEAAFAASEGNSTDVHDILETRIKNICQACSTNEFTVFLTGDGNFRSFIYPEYKKNRGERPFYYDTARQILCNYYSAVIVDGMEADDALAVNQTEDTIICTIDKDLKQVPGWHYRWTTWNSEGHDPKLVSPFGFIEYDKKKGKLNGEGYIWFRAQTLMGDKVDNIPPLKGWGPAKVFRNLADATSELEADMIVRDAFLSEASVEDMARNTNLVWIVREVRDGFPVLWSGDVYRG